MKIFLSCVHNEVSKVGEKGECTTELYVPVEEGLLPPAKMSASFYREDILEVVAVLSLYQEKPRDIFAMPFRLCSALHEMLSAGLTIYLH